MLKMIICSASDNAIGRDNKLLEHIPSDLAYFKKQTEGHVVVMGRKTFESLPFDNGLPKRDNIVLSSIPVKSPLLEEGYVTYVTCLSCVLRFIKDYEEILKNKDTWFIGGASVYNQVKDVVEEVHWTKINRTYEDADTFFDMSWVEDEDVFEMVSEEILCEDVSVGVYKRKEK